jgi:putative transposase
MYYLNQHIYSEKHNINLRVCYVSTLFRSVALADMTLSLKNNNVKKPVSMKFDELHNFIKSHNAEVKKYSLPPEINKSDKELIVQGKQHWIEKRDDKLNIISDLINPAILEKYLFSDGIFNDIEKTMCVRKFKSKGYYYNILNRYITFGCTPNSLLPFKFKNVGSKYLHNDNEKNVKRGRGGKNNEHSRSKTKGITIEAKKQIIAVFKYAKSKNYRKFPYKKLFEDYQDNFEMQEWLRPGLPTVSFPKPEDQRISYGQFYYHIKLLISTEQYLRLSHGDVSYEKDFAPRSGVARDGVIGPGYRYEIDSTVIDLYVRYPYDTSGRYTMGRPILYVVVDTYSTCIVGFYIGFSGPNWAGASEALVNACMDKVAFCAQYDITITEDDWPCSHIPVEIAMDNGTDYPTQANINLLQSMIGIQAAIYLALYRGDAKGVCERKFGVFNDTLLHFEAGSIFKETRREDTHASNQAIWDLDSLKKVIIQEIIYHNKTSNRLRLHNFDLSENQVGITPNAIYKYAINREMNGGRKTTDEDIKLLRWALLEELEATVDEKGVWLQGVLYDCEYLREHKWTTRAKLEGNFKVFVRRSRSSTNYIWYRTDLGDIITLEIKEYDSERYANQHWECILHRIEEYKSQVHDLALEQLNQRAMKEDFKNHQRDIQQEILNQAPENTRKSPQLNIKDRSAIEKAISSHQILSEINECLTGGKPTTTSTSSAVPELDIDDEFYKS